MQRHRAASGGKAAEKTKARGNLIQAIVDEPTANWVRRQADRKGQTVSAFIRMMLVEARARSKAER